MLNDQEIKELENQLHKLKLYLIHNPDIKVSICRRGKSIVLDERITSISQLDK